MTIQGLNPNNNFCHTMPINNGQDSSCINESKIPETKTDSKIQDDTKSLWNEIYDFGRKYIPLEGSYLTAIGHLASAFAHTFNLSTKGTVDQFALNLSKIMLSANCLIQAKEAFKENRIIEVISRILEPIFIIVEKRVEDLGLARAIGLGISQLVESQDGIFQEILKQKNINPKNITAGQDVDINIQAGLKLAKEILRGGLGKDRRFMTGFSWHNIQNALANFSKQFNFSSLKEIFNQEHGDIRNRLQAFYDTSGLSHIKTLCEGNKAYDKGHTTALSGYMMMFGSLIGYFDKQSKGVFYKIGGTLRNLGGMVADVSIFGHPDTMHNLSSPFLLVNGFMDMLQRFIPSRFNNLTKVIGNISMAFYNVGVAIYLNRSNDKTNDKEHIKHFDADLKDARVIVPAPVELARPVQNKSTIEKQFASAA